MFATRIEDGSVRRIIIRPNRSLTWEQTKIVYACIAIYSLAIAGALAVMGFWPVLPFAGGEIALLGVAFYVNALAGTSVQVVTVGGDVVKVEKEKPGAAVRVAVSESLGPGRHRRARRASSEPSGGAIARKRGGARRVSDRDRAQATGRNAG